MAIEVIVNEIHDRMEGGTVGGRGVEFEETPTKVDTNTDDHLVGLDGEGKEVTGIVAVSEDE